ncbi:Gp138 family membrane-puncturing spike protein [Erwinia sp. HR93]|uniref:Gp138 family membrane-puncturing spike protein n=1 Tax=Erwinia sp. HR93 TaxID=3094840 RepID=UPI002ADEEA5C|nr:Gp138 family membrane-puncturing spike protein [Erwinia sp. HR93]MEA1064752.1 Gp138 family membrane-puncturing spike protein [Erwinia sp. HR93]
MSILNRDTASFDSVMAQAGGDLSSQIRVALPAIVTEFNAERQTVTLQPAIAGTGADGAALKMPPLADVPVKFPRGGGFAFTFPVAAGDEGLAVFSDRCIDGWFSSGQVSQADDHRQHDLSDAFFLPGVSSIARAIGSFRTDAVVMRQLSGSGYVSIDNGGNVDIDGAKLTVHCQTEFLNTATVQGLTTCNGGVTAQGGEGAAVKISGSAEITGGDLTVDGIGSKSHHHVDSQGGNTSGAKP